MSLSNKKRIAVVTGGSGFIGSHMTDLLLDEGFEVRVVDSLVSGHLGNLKHREGDSSLKIEVKDLRELSPDAALFKGVEYVFHFAGVGDIVPSVENPIKYMSNNVMGTVHALECARYSGVKKFVYAASSSCYGLAKELPTSETAPIVPEYPYALSKYQGEQAALHWEQLYGLPVNSIRMFNVYGPRSRTTGAYGAVFGVFLKQKLADQPFTVVGDGAQTRDFVFVTDVVKAFYAVAQSPHSGEVYNLGAGSPQSVNRLVELLGGQVTYIPKREGEPDCTWANTAKIREHTQWTPVVNFEEGVQEMLNQIHYWKDAPLWDPDSIRQSTAAWHDVFGRKDAENA